MKKAFGCAAGLLIAALACPLVWAADPAIVFVDEAKAGAKAIMVMDADGSNRREIFRTEKRFTDGGGPRLSPSISPDGEWVSYIKAEGDEGLGWAVYKIPVAGGEPQKLLCSQETGTVQVVPAAHQWSPNGKEIAVQIDDFFNNLESIIVIPSDGIPHCPYDLDLLEVPYPDQAGWDGSHGITWNPYGSQLALLEWEEASGKDWLTIIDRVSSSVNRYEVVFPAGSFDGVTWLSFSRLDWQRSGDLVFAFDSYSEAPTGRFEKAWRLSVSDQIAFAEEISEGQSPTWSPDDSQLLLGASRVAGSPPDMTLVTVSTGESVLFGSGYDPDWKRGPVTVCGDGTCEVAENQCNCADDCGAYPPTEAAACIDSVDNDCDEFIDCDDSDCSNDQACADPYCGDGFCDLDEDHCSCSSDCGLPSDSEVGLCSDGIDNDCDLTVDCADPDCTDDTSCIGVLPGDPCTIGADCLSGLCHPKKKVCK